MNTCDKTHKISIWFVCLFTSFFLLYQLSLGLHSTLFPPDEDSFFGTDNMGVVLNSPKQKDRLDIDVIKHPLAFGLALPLYRLGTTLYSWVPGFVGQNLGLAFPFAFLGAVNICVSFWLFLLNYPSLRNAILFTLLYGLSTSTWFFSSFPETYVITALCTNIFLSMCLRQIIHTPTVSGVVGTHLLTCYTAPSQALLAIVPCLHYLRYYYWSRKGWYYLVLYGLILVIAFLIPYVLFVRMMEYSWHFPYAYVRSYGSFSRMFYPSWLLVLPLNLLVFSIVGPVVHPDLYSDRSLAILSQVSWAWIVLAGGYVIFAGRCLWGTKGSPATAVQLRPAMLLFIMCYMIFLLFFNPGESYLYTLPVLMPWLLLLHAGYLSCRGWLWRAVVLFLLMGTAINSLQLILLIHRLS